MKGSRLAPSRRALLLFDSWLRFPSLVFLVFLLLKHLQQSVNSSFYGSDVLKTA